MTALRGIAGIALLLALAWVLSTNRRRFPLRTVLGGMALQWVLAVLVLQTDVGRDVFNGIATVVTVILDCTNEGARFVLGNLVDIRQDSWGVVFAAKVLPSIIVFSSLSALGYHLGVLQFVVGIVARVMQKLMGVSGAESLSAAGNVFLGQTEAPLLVRPYIPRMTESELMALMVGGFATIAGGVLASYVAILGGDDPAKQVEVARHFLTAMLMSAPASFVVAKIMVPETQVPETIGSVRLQVERKTRNVVHAAAVGASDGLKLALNVAAMLIAFIAVIAIIDRLLLYVGGLGPIQPLVAWMGLEQLDLGGLLGLVFAPVAYIIGVDRGDCQLFGGLLGKAMATNEFVAYLSLSDLAREGAVNERTIRLATYSLCGFANLSSIAIQIAGIGGMAPERRADLARLGLRAMFGGAMACWMTGCIAGILT
ncbi:MAG TPA: nucleoside transporter C-terminal domain-containing protein [Phycisphaerae bacterium]|nr:nucleoside transporter C-terminal domain-containing protein [Phycisphaerae bacterium]